MYERYEFSERVFVDREENLNWMNNALTRCKDRTIVLHLRGIGGIGKSTLIEHWNNVVETSIFLDCSRVINIFDRLDAFAKGRCGLASACIVLTFFHQFGCASSKVWNPRKSQGVTGPSPLSNHCHLSALLPTLAMLFTLSGKNWVLY